MRILTLLILLSSGFQVTGQTYADSVSLETLLDSLTVDTASYYDDQEEDSVYISSQYTKKPGQLPVTQQETNRQYRKQGFDKEAWKKIVGDKRYDEKTTKQTKKASMPQMSIDPMIIKVIGYTAIFGLLAFLIYLFIKQALNDPSRKSISTNSALFSDQTAPHDVADLDLEALLREALAQNNLRIAVRLYYIKLLKHLNNEGFIRWEKDKTNRDYANELASNGFSNEFKKIMTAYEYVWYGERTPSPQEFTVLESNFKTLYQTHR